jgi:ribosomal protein S12 methylthiotransferase accessory factor
MPTPEAKRLDQPIVTRTSTYRTATPEQTRARVEPMLGRFGITRIADVTRLDEIGLPVHVAYRPCGRTLAVSIGIGLQATQSWVSAAMESIETWHAENLRLPIATRDCATRLGLPYDVRSLNLAKRSLLSESTVLDWVVGRGVLSGEEVLVPIDLIELDFTKRLQWGAVFFRASSNGMATGNTHAEATLHALTEVIERDACAPVAELTRADRIYADPGSADHPVAQAVLAALRRADCHVELYEATNELGIPTYACSVWSVDVPVFYSGYGCHLDSGLAAARAMFEAALSRLAGVSGARDDLDELFYQVADPLADPASAERILAPIGGSVGPDDSIDAVTRFCAQRIQDVTQAEPVVVDLTHEDIGIPVSKVIAPGLRMLGDGMVSRRPSPRRRGEHHG